MHGVVGGHAAGSEEMSETHDGKEKAGRDGDDRGGARMGVYSLSGHCPNNCPQQRLIITPLFLRF